MGSTQVISKRELKTLFYVGRKLELIGCYVPMAAPQARVVKTHRSYGYDMEKPDGKVSRLDFNPGQIVEAYSPAGNGYTEVIISDPGPLHTVAAHYRLL
jgi:hypothetical protein